MYTIYNIALWYAMYAIDMEMNGYIAPLGILNVTTKSIHSIVVCDV